MRDKWNILFATLILTAMSSTSAALAGENGGGGGYDGDKVYVDRYYIIPGTGEWASIETGIPDSPKEFRFELKCFDDLVGDLQCLSENRNACTAGVGGRLVYWFSRFKGASQWLPIGSGPSCIYSEKPRDIGDQIRDTILSELQSRPIMPGVLGMQPSPYALMGAHTNFYVEADMQVFDFVLFEQNIRIVTRPTEYEWNYGDGTTYGPAPFAGAPLPEGRWGEETPTSHIYRSTGDFQASVIVYFSGEYSINGGPMVPIDGRATVPSVPQTVSVWKSDSRNVADDCLVNPAGFGC